MKLQKNKPLIGIVKVELLKYKFRQKTKNR